jgi:hypothetical protein
MRGETVQILRSLLAPELFATGVMNLITSGDVAKLSVCVSARTRFCASLVFGPWFIFQRLNRYWIDIGVVYIVHRVKQSRYTPWRRGGRGGIAPTHSLPRH